MKMPFCFALSFLSAALPVVAQDDEVLWVAEAAAPVQKPGAKIAGWGEVVNPDGDCKFFLNKKELLISVPASDLPRDLAAEINRINAPRVIQPVKGDFVFQVKVDGRFNPGDVSTQEGRTGYNGGAVILMADPQNVVTLARAVLHRRGGEAMPYANYEMRSEGKVDRIGNANDFPLPDEGPVYLRLERRGQTLTAAVSVDAEKWNQLPQKELPAAWPADLFIGVTAITTSQFEFNPRFSELQLLK